MRNWTILFFTSLALLTTSGCSSATKGRIVETEKGSLKAIGSAKDEPDARITAIDQAENYCLQSNRKPIFNEDELEGKFRKKKFNLNIKNLPVIGKVFEGDDKTQIIIGFRCRHKV